MRLWNRSIIKFLPDNQLRGQWRECALIAYGIEKNGIPNHLLVNKIMEYPIDDFLSYCCLVREEMNKRGFRITSESEVRLALLGTYQYVEKPFENWHNKEYLRVCMANLYEKHVFGVGKSRITDEEWQRLVYGYRQITGEEYVI
jgi:uncharacterized protein (TIGR02328 family)